MVKTKGVQYQQFKVITVEIPLKQTTILMQFPIKTPNAGKLN